MDEKLQRSAMAYRRRIAEIEGQQKRTKLLPNEDVEVMVKGKRLRVQSSAVQGCNRMEVELSSEDEEGPTPVCTYPKGRGAISLYSGDMERLNEGRFLNDQIINLVLKWAYDHTLSPTTQAHTHVCDTFLYEALLAGLNKEGFAANDGELGKLGANIQKVLNNPKEAMGLRKNVILVPACEDSHWFLVAIIRDQSTSTILLLDSLAQHPRPHAAKACRQLVAAAAGGQSCITAKVKVTQQGNGYDCGVHLLHNATMLLHHTEDHPCSELDILEEYLRRPMATRQHLRRLITEIGQESTRPTIQANPPPKQQQANPPPKQQQANPLPQQQANPPPKQPQANPPKQQQANPSPQPQQANPLPQQQQANPLPQQQQANPSPQQQQANPPLKQLLANPPQGQPQPPATQKTLRKQTEAVVLRPKERQDLGEGIELDNTTKTDWTIPEELAEMFAQEGAASRATLHHCHQRRRIFVKRTEFGVFRFQIDRASGRCVIRKLDG